MFSPIPSVLEAISSQASMSFVFSINPELENPENFKALAEELATQLLEKYEDSVSQEISVGSKLYYAYHETGYQGFLIQTDANMDYLVVYTPQNDSIFINHGPTHSLLENLLQTQKTSLPIAILAHVGMWALAGSDKFVLGSTHEEAYQQEVDSAMMFGKQRAIQQNLKLNALRRLIETAHNPEEGESKSEDVDYLSFHQDPTSKVHYIDFYLDLAAGSAKGRLYLPTEIGDTINYIQPVGIMLHDQPVENLSLVNLGDTRPNALHMNVGEEEAPQPLFDRVFAGLVPVSHQSINSICTELEEIQNSMFREKMVVVPEREVAHMKQAMEDAVSNTESPHPSEEASVEPDFNS